MNRVFIRPKEAVWYAVFIFILTVVLGYFFPYYSVAGGGIIITVFLTTFIPGKKSSYFTTLVGAVALAGFAFFHKENAGLTVKLTHYFFSLLLIVFTLGIVLYLKNLMQHIAFDETHMTSLFENTTEGILLTGGKGQIILANPSAQQMFGYAEDEMQGKTVEMLLPDDIKDKHVGLRDGFYHHPQNRAMGSGRDLYARHKSGHVFPVEVSLSHYRKGNDIYVIAFIVDITKRKDIEKNLVRKQQELEKVTNDVRKLNTQLEMKVEERTQILKEALQKLEKSQEELHEALEKEKELSEIKSRFVSMASHEFRTPLSAVLSSASLLSRYTKEDEQDKRNKHISRIKDSVKHLNDILEDFLSLGKLDEGRIQATPSHCNLHLLVEETLGDIKHLLKPGQRINYVHDGARNIFADSKLLKNILINLISNAIKFSGEDDVIDVTASVNHDTASLSIEDHGIGISEEDQKHLFSSFFRASNAMNIQGTGLGLHIVKRYVDLLGGTVHLQSELGRGTRVTITIPVKEKT